MNTVLVWSVNGLELIFFRNTVTKMEMVFLKWQTKAAKSKIMGLFTWSTYKQKYSNNISIKKGLRSKQATTKCSIKSGEASKQTAITLQKTCLHLQRFCKGKGILLQVHLLHCFSLQYKRQDRAGNGWRKNSVSLVWRHVACEENNCGLKISVKKDLMNNYYYVRERNVKNNNNESKLLLFKSNR